MLKPKILLVSLSLAASPLWAQIQTGTPPTDGPRPSEVGQTIIEEESQHRIEMETKRRALDLAVMDQKLAETKEKIKEAENPKSSTSGPGFPVVPMGQPIPQTAGNNAKPEKIPVVELPPPPAPTLSGIVGTHAIFKTDGGYVDAMNGSTVGAYKVSSIESNGVTLVHGKKTVNLQLERK